MKTPRYFEKFKQQVPQIVSPGEVFAPDEDSFFTFLEDLNASDWAKFIEDIALEAPWPASMSQRRSGTNILQYYAVFFDKLGTTPNKLIRDVLNTRVHGYLNDPSNAEQEQILRRFLELSWTLCWGIDSEILAERLIKGENIPEDIRTLAATALAIYDAEESMPLSFWTEEIDLKAHPSLAYPRILALEEPNPVKALETYTQMSLPPEATELFERPTFHAVTKLLQEVYGISILSDLLQKMPKWASTFIEDKVLHAEDRRAQKLGQQAIVAAPAAKIDPFRYYLNNWAARQDLLDSVRKIFREYLDFSTAMNNVLRQICQNMSAKEALIVSVNIISVKAYFWTSNPTHIEKRPLLPESTLSRLIDYPLPNSIVLKQHLSANAHRSVINAPVWVGTQLVAVFSVIDIEGLDSSEELLNNWIQEIANEIGREITRAAQKGAT